jgi:hypothetical protein
MDETRHAQSWDSLADAINDIVYTRDPVPERRFELRRDDAHNYAVLYIFTYTPDTYRRDEMRYTRHEFVVPVATYHKAAWTRWVFDRIVSIEMHETCESFQVRGDDGDLYRPYAPHHGNGEDPYAFWPGGTVEQKSKAPGED